MRKQKSDLERAEQEALEFVDAEMNIISACDIASLRNDVNKWVVENRVLENF